MRYILLAADYDGTLAHDGIVPPATIAVLEKLRRSGRKLVLVSGRILADLQAVFDRFDLFERVVVENGAVLYAPESREEQPLTEPVPPRLVEALRTREVPFGTGRCILATSEPHQQQVVEAIRDLGLEYQVIFNKGAVMVLPSGINKGSGLKRALEDLELSEHNVVAVGDAENDHALLGCSEFAAAVANAIPSLRDRADLVLVHAASEGVEELVGSILQDDLISHDSSLVRRSILIGEDEEGAPVLLPPPRGSILFAGASASGKSTAASGVIERIAEAGYQFCLIDPEGDFEQFGGALSFGTEAQAPDTGQVLNALRSPTENVVINLLAIPLADRPVFFSTLFAHLQSMRTALARPHWLVIDEAHHLLPRDWKPEDSAIPETLGGMLLITVHPAEVSRAILDRVDVVAGFGQDAGGTVQQFATAVGVEAPGVPAGTPNPGEALVWFRRTREPLHLIKAHPAKEERRRHRRKYAAGSLPDDRSFFFRGPENALNLRANNLNFFVELARGIDAATWIFHLRQHDYSRWFRTGVKDEELAREAEAVENDANLPPETSRDHIIAAIEERYTAAA